MAVENFNRAIARLNESERPRSLLELLRELEWSEHHYDPSHSHSYTCPICGGASPEGDLRNIHQKFGHRKDCDLQRHIKGLTAST